jgi:type IV secretion system protein TrbD
MSALRHLPFSRSLNRPLLLLGGERKPVILFAVMALLLFLSDISPVKFVLALLLWSFAVGLLRLMAKIDPSLSQVYLRRLKYQAFYPALSRAFK